MVPWWVGLIGVILGPAISIVATAVRDSNQRASSRRGHFEALASEIRIDRAQDVLMQRPDDRADKRLDREVRRAQLKARKLAPGGAPAPTHYDAALAVCGTKLPKVNLTRLNLQGMGESDEDKPAHGVDFGRFGRI